MSRNHTTLQASIDNVITDVSHMQAKEVLTTYGIAIDQYGKIHDTTYNKDFTTLSDWARYFISENEDEQNLYQEYEEVGFKG